VKNPTDASLQHITILNSKAGRSRVTLQTETTSKPQHDGDSESKIRLLESKIRALESKDGLREYKLKCAHAMIEHLHERLRGYGHIEFERVTSATTPDTRDQPSHYPRTQQEIASGSQSHEDIRQPNPSEETFRATEASESLASQDTTGVQDQPLDRPRTRSLFKEATECDDVFNKDLTKTSPADVIMWSGTKDQQTS
jgi:hypothetical protein